MKVLFCGDLYPGGDFENCDPRGAVTAPVFHAADFRVATLETALSDRSERADKSVLTCSSAGAAAVRDMGLHAVSLAQNHIQDMGPHGILDTIQHLDAAGILHTGAGKTIAEAIRPAWIGDGLCILAFCRYRALTLNQIAVADEESPGVAILTPERVRSALDQLPPGARAILVFHWGCEHLWLTPYDNIELARELLADERVALIIGSHPHRVQGYIEHAGKRAYFSLGNFLFSNFYLDAPCIQVSPSTPPAKPPTTRFYHPVHRLTHKRWLLVNRISMVVTYNTETGKAQHQFLMQRDARPEVTAAPAWVRLTFGLWVRALAVVSTHLPKTLYQPLFATHHRVTFWILQKRILLTRVRNRGLAGIWAKLRARLHSSAHSQP